jgi:hypothetical protein
MINFLQYLHFLLLDFLEFILQFIFVFCLHLAVIERGLESGGCLVVFLV